MKEPDIKGPVAWQKFGDKWCLTGQYGMRPIFLSTDPKGNLRLRDDATDRLIPFDPQHPFARKVVSALNEYEALCAVAEAASKMDFADCNCGCSTCRYCGLKQTLASLAAIRKDGNG